MNAEKLWKFHTYAYSTRAGNETNKDTEFKYFLLKSTENCEDFGVLDFEKRFIWSG